MLCPHCNHFAELVSHCCLRRLLRVFVMQGSFLRRIMDARGSELSTLWRSFIVSSLNAMLLNAVPILVSVGTFAAYVLLGHNLSAAKVCSFWEPFWTRDQ